MLLAGIIIYLSLFAVIMVVILKSAPNGYENENGFHLGNDISIDENRKAAA
ncbi:MAG: hypothetical protein GYA14_12920 [Ignavibacteria bacterium]|nr:hypothetical protein [Ignavibacteria bacterium]